LSPKILFKSEFLGYSLLIISLICGIRPLNSMAIAWLMLTAILMRTTGIIDKVSRKPAVYFIYSCFLFYLLNIASLFYTSDIAETIKHLQIKSSLVFIPLFLLLHFPDRLLFERLKNVFVFSLLIAVIFCLISAGFRFFTNSGDTSVFFYHSLVKPFKQHAVQFSLLVFFALTEIVVKLFRKDYFANALIDIAIAVVFSIFLFLLSSKLIITLFVMFIFCFLIKAVSNRKFLAILITIVLLLIAGIYATKNPVSNRFAEIVQSDFNLISQPGFNQGTYFNGLQFRLLQWKNVTELLQENNAFVFGLSPGDAQDSLNRKYISKDMYFGTPERKERGFIGYNAHNEFLESSLQLGLVGLSAFIMMIIGLIRIAIKAASIQLSFIVGALAAFCLTESVLETQYGLVILTFFPIFFYLGTRQAKAKEI